MSNFIGLFLQSMADYYFFKGIIGATLKNHKASSVKILNTSRLLLENFSYKINDWIIKWNLIQYFSLKLTMDNNNKQQEQQVVLLITMLLLLLVLMMTCSFLSWRSPLRTPCSCPQPIRRELNFFFSEDRRSRRRPGCNQDGCQTGIEPGTCSLQVRT